MSLAARPWRIGLSAGGSEIGGTSPTAKVSMAIALSAGCARCALVSQVSLAEIARTHGDNDFCEALLGCPRLHAYPPVVFNTTQVGGLSSYTG